MLKLQQIHDLRAINRLLREAYDHYFAGSDGYAKSSEGYVSVSFGNYWDRAADWVPGDKVEVLICSYVFGENRNNHFTSTAGALAAVKEWHTQEMGTTYDASGDWVTRPIPDGNGSIERNAYLEDSDV